VGLPFVNDAQRWALIEGDSLAVLHTLDSVDHVITDPPYSEHVHGKATRGHGMRMPDGNGRMTMAAYGRRTDLGFEHLTARDRRAFARAYARLAKRWVLVFTDTESTHLWRRSLEVAGLRFMRQGFWDKIGSTPQFTGDRPSSACDSITMHHPKGRAHWNGGGKRGIWSFPIVANRAGHRFDREHTTQKPIDLMLALVADFTDPGDIVLDSHAGSGTTGVACLRLGRRFIRIEKDPKYAQICRERLAAEAIGQDVESYRAGQERLF
jgi:hypothetical protein